MTPTKAEGVLVRLLKGAATVHGEKKEDVIRSVDKWDTGV